MKDKYLKILSLIFLLIFIFHLSLSIYEGEPRASLWFCATLLIVFAFGLYYKNTLILSSVVVSAFVIEFLWTIDIISYTLSRKLVLGILPYLYDISLMRFIITYYHILLLIVPIIIIIFSLKKFHKHAWIFSSFHLLIVFIISIITKAEFNCIKKSCELGIFNFVYVLRPEFLPYFIFHWLGLTIVIFIPTNILFTFLSKKLATSQINFSKQK